MPEVAERERNAGIIGQAQTVLVLGRGDDACAAVTQLGVSVAKGLPPGTIEVRGGCSIDPSALAHYHEVLVPLLQGIAHAVGLELPGFWLHVTNIGAASQQDRPLSIEGYSAGLSLLVACLSAWLRMPPVSGVLATGHIADVHGTVRMVGQLSAKVAAAKACAHIHGFIYPDPDSDASLDDLSPGTREAIRDAIEGAKEGLEPTPVSSVDDAVAAAFSEEALLTAALRNGYFSKNGSAHPLPILMANLERRYWDCLEGRLLQGLSVSELLDARVVYAQLKGAYPAGFGLRLYQALAALPPVVRERRVIFPLLRDASVMDLLHASAEQDVRDVRRLLDAHYGDRFERTGGRSTGRPSAQPPEDAARAELQVLLEDISADELGLRVRRPIDEARAQFTLDSVTASSVAECLDTVSALLRAMNLKLGVEGRDGQGYGTPQEALNLLERTFARQGGLKAAYAEAMEGTRGRMRLVLDAVATQYRHDQEEMYVGWVLRLALDGMAYEDRCALVLAFMDLVRPCLPPGEGPHQPERYVDDLGPLIRAYVQSMDQLRETFRAM